MSRHWGLPKPRKLFRVSGLSPPLELSGFNNSIDTLESAVKERVFYVKKDGVFSPPPKPQPGHFRETLSGVLRALRCTLPRTAPMSRRQFVDSFRGRKWKVYQRAYEQLLRRGLLDKDSYVKVFVKYEKTDYTRKTDPVPRVISPRAPEYNIELGRFLRPVEERIFDSLGHLFGHVTVFKGMNASTMGRRMAEKWGMFRNPVAVGLDASRFDQHVSIDALEWEHSVYRSIYFGRRRRQLDRLLRRQLFNHCSGYTADGRLKYTLEGGRMSGDMNTSLGNCVLMCSMIKAYSEHCGVRLQLANNGDDCVVFMESADLARFTAGLDAWFTAMGFTMAVEKPCYQLEEVEFCQTHPVRIGLGIHDYLMVRHPKWAIAKDTTCTHAYQSSALRRGWMYAVGEAGLSMTGGVPIFQNFYRTLMRSGRHHHSVASDLSWGVRKLAEGLHRSWSPVLPETRASFYHAFGVTPCEQRVIEGFYDGYKFVDTWESSLRYQPLMPL